MSNRTVSYFPSQLPMQSSHGFSILDLLAALLIVSLLFLMTFPLLRSSLQIDSRIRRRELLEVKAATAIASITQAIDKGQRLYAILSLRIQPPGRILLADGSRHAVHDRARSLQPSPASNALTVMELEPSLAMIRLSGRDSPTETAATNIYCLRMRSAPPSTTKSIAEIESWLGAGLDGCLLLKGKLKRSTRSRFCMEGRTYLGSLSADRAPLFTCKAPDTISDSGILLTKAQLTANIEVLLPITEYYTLYVDRKGTLRHLSHDSTENQPLLDGVERLAITSEAASSHYSLLGATVTVIDRNPGNALTKKVYRTTGSDSNHALADLLF